jgi:hypothetical protein
MLASPIDQQKLATDLAIRAIDRIATAGSKILSVYWQRHKARDVSAYSQYIVKTGVHANAVRNFVYGTHSASLYDIYVPTVFDNNYDFQKNSKRQNTSDDFLRSASTMMRTD